MQDWKNTLKLRLAVLLVLVAFIPMPFQPTQRMARLGEGLSFAATSSTTPNGLAAYAGPVPTGTSFDLPFVAGGWAPPQTAATFDTIVRVANATSGSTAITLQFYALDGSLSSGTIQSLAAQSSMDIDVGLLWPGNGGTALLSATPNAVGVVVDVVEGGSGIADNIASYTGIPPGSISMPASMPLYENLANGGTSSLYLQNPSAFSASATVTFAVDGVVAAQQAYSLPSNGGVVVSPSSVSDLPSNWTGTVEVTSAQPLAVTELTWNATSLDEGSVVYGSVLIPGALGIPDSAKSANETATSSPRVTSAATTVTTSGKGARASNTRSLTPLVTDQVNVLSGTPCRVYVPAYAYIAQQSGATTYYESSAVSITNLSTGATAYAVVDFYEPSGTLLSESSTIQIPASSSYGVPNPTVMESGFVGSVVVSADQPVAVSVDDATTNGASSSYQGSVLCGSGTGILPGIRKSANGESTIIALQNVQFGSSTYTLSYWDHTGNLIAQELGSLAQNGSILYAQALDPALPDGFDGLVTISVPGSGSLPAAVVEVSAGTVGASPTPTPSPTSSVPTPTWGPGLGTPRALYLPLVDDNSH